MAVHNKEWIYNTIKLLKKNSKKIHMVTGQILPFPNQKVGLMILV